MCEHPVLTMSWRLVLLHMLLAIFTAEEVVFDFNRFMPTHEDEPSHSNGRRRTRDSQQQHLAAGTEDALLARTKLRLRVGLRYHQGEEPGEG